MKTLTDNIVENMVEEQEGPEWTCSECGNQEGFTDIVNKNTIDDYDIQCNECESLDICDSPIEALHKVIEERDALKLITPIEPDICTSLHCNSNPCLYCKDCSHAFFIGEGIDENKNKWRWEFSKRFGVSFIDDEGKILENQPDPYSFEIPDDIEEWPETDHPAWALFETWLEKLNKVHSKIR